MMAIITRSQYELNELPPRTNQFRRFTRVFFGRKVVIIGVIILLAFVLTAIFAPVIAPHDPNKQNLEDALSQPSGKHLLGTDHLGRDILSRIIHGARISLIVGLIVVTTSTCIGSLVGLVTGYFGGIIDMLIMRFLDALLSIPLLMLAIVIGATVGGGLNNIIISLTIAIIPVYARLMRGQVLSIKQADYIMASNAIGCSDSRIILLHVFPNCVSPLIVLMTLNLGTAILAEASLSFLGLGVFPPQAAWGAMVSAGYRYLLKNPIISIAPGLCVMLVVLAFNIVGDGLRDALDPRLRGTI